jgi:hypothetical protein
MFDNCKAIKRLGKPVEIFDNKVAGPANDMMGFAKLNRAPDSHAFHSGK